MSADPTRTLLSMDLLDDDDHDRLDEWGNRAVLTEPAAEPVSIPDLYLGHHRCSQSGCGDAPQRDAAGGRRTRRSACQTGRGVVPMALTGL